jgi:hypothetical protein
MKVRMRPVVVLQLPLLAVLRTKAAAVPMVIIAANLLHQDKAVILLPVVVLAQAAAVHPQTVVAVVPVLPQIPADEEDNAELENENFDLKNNFS